MIRNMLCQQDSQLNIFYHYQDTAFERRHVYESETTKTSYICNGSLVSYIMKMWTLLACYFRSMSKFQINRSVTVKQYYVSYKK